VLNMTATGLCTVHCKCGDTLHQQACIQVQHCNILRRWSSGSEITCGVPVCMEMRCHQVIGSA
jgi:hypothetical protein